MYNAVSNTLYDTMYDTVYGGCLGSLCSNKDCLVVCQEFVICFIISNNTVLTAYQEFIIYSMYNCTVYHGTMYNYNTKHDASTTTMIIYDSVSPYLIDANPNDTFDNVKGIKSLCCNDSNNLVDNFQFDESRNSSSNRGFNANINNIFENATRDSFFFC